MPRCEGTGPLTADIMVVGEAPGEQEEMLGAPFIGASGQELTRMLADASVERGTVYLTNVLKDRPPGNDLELWCEKKRPKGSQYPAIKPGFYLDLARQEAALAELQSEIEMVKPNVIIAMGNTATWALLRDTGITKLRGTTAEWITPAGERKTAYKVLPTYHPAAVLRNWRFRVIVIADIIKAAVEAKFTGIKRPWREIMVAETIEDIHLFIDKYLPHSNPVSLDIETAHGQITCVGVSDRPELALVIPFVDKRKKDYSYWSTAEEEIAAWDIIASLPHPMVFQNGVYDMQWLWRKAGVAIKNAAEDTMLDHHSQYPELPKGLGFLGSVYTDEQSWKQLRTRDAATTKRDDE